MPLSPRSLFASEWAVISIFPILIGSLGLVAGCSQATTNETVNDQRGESAADAAPTGQPQDLVGSQGSVAEVSEPWPQEPRPLETNAVAPSPAAPTAMARAMTQYPAQAPSSQQARQPDSAFNPTGPRLDPQPLQPSGRQLRSDLSPTELIRFLGDIDQEMRGLINGQSRISDPEAIEAEVQRVVQLKRTAAQRLMNHHDADESAMITGSRGYLQAMSHTAAMGDVQAAEKLEIFAEQHRDAANQNLRSDSRLVLIGFAIESLRHGKQDAAQRVLTLMRDVASNQQSVDVATLMVMGQAKDALLQYEHVGEAEEVRDLILGRFADSSDPEVARMAAMIAASGFAEQNKDLQRLQQLRMGIVEPSRDQPEVTVGQWRSAVEAVINKSVDLLTVQFLAGMSLEAETLGREDIAEVTYAILANKIADRTDAIGREATTALRARDNRESVIGEVFSPDLPSVDGSLLDMADFRGKVVLMPFWSSAFPDSLLVLPNLEAIRDQHPNDVAIIGLNLDLDGTDVQGFMRENGLRFPCYRSVSDSQAGIANETAYRFGAVTLLFVAIIDQGGKVMGVDFSGRDLTEMVEKQIR